MSDHYKLVGYKGIHTVGRERCHGAESARTTMASLLSRGAKWVDVYKNGTFLGMFRHPDKPGDFGRGNHRDSATLVEL